MNTSVNRVSVLDLPVDAVNFEGVLDWVKRNVSVPGFKRIVAVNPEKVMAARRDPELKEFLTASDLLIPDGIGVVYAVRLLHGINISRVAGSDLMPAICGLAAQEGFRVFIYGAKPEVNARSVEILKKRFKGLDIAGSGHGYIPDNEMDELVNNINASGADILFVALGSPRQEQWMLKYGPRLNVKVAQGIGGTLDTIAGNVKRAPAFFQKLHLEWFYRLVSNPKRAGRQVVLPVFAGMVLTEKIRKLFS